MTKTATEQKPRSRGRLGELLGFSVVSVITRLGMAGVTIPHALAILKANKVKAAQGTVAQNIRIGSKGGGRPATITKDQLRELIGSAPAPEPNGKAPEPKAKRSRGAAKRPRTRRKARTPVKAQADAEKPQGEAAGASGDPGF